MMEWTKQDSRDAERLTRVLEANAAKKKTHAGVDLGRQQITDPRPQRSECREGWTHDVPRASSDQFTEHDCHLHKGDGPMISECPTARQFGEKEAQHGEGE